MPREEWRVRLDLAATQIDAVQVALLAAGEIAVTMPAQPGQSAALMRLPEHQPCFTAAQTAARDALLTRLTSDPWNPPPLAELEALAGRDVLAALVENGTLVRLADDIVL